MAQYCRYCVFLHVNDAPYCDIKEKHLSESSCKKSNNCKDYSFAACEPEYQDAFMENDKGYQPGMPKKPRSKDCEGQMSLFE